MSPVTENSFWPAAHNSTIPQHLSFARHPSDHIEHLIHENIRAHLPRPIHARKSDPSLLFRVTELGQTKYITKRISSPGDYRLLSWASRPKKASRGRHSNTRGPWISENAILESNVKSANFPKTGCFPFEAISWEVDPMFSDLLAAEPLELPAAN